MMSLWDALRMNMMISYQELVRTFPNRSAITPLKNHINTPGIMIFSYSTFLSVSAISACK
ncbi:hypothetical protein C3F37_08100 [Salmonella enterica subsp. enterica serovar Senftenberg]|nr:hypothetical protein C3F37_08100 [Salmonella enterica subsp. enterica serovar Senftenberg]QBY72788.1 hypothetical protein EIP71_13825 [Salmonella enterica subsp. enterica serovar Senftenberg]QBY82050.1 hypothetical protein EIO66_13820 [Salmonella enterica subsp. enterica serovar Senftenberg]QCC12590.1 hypothetical protein EIP70_13825 [Salmonella enterica subsp. enterica serovar Senftenberg]